MARALKIGFLVLLVAIVALGSALVLYLRSDAFDRWIRGKIVETLEKRYAVRVQLGEVDLNIFQTQFELRDLQIYNRMFPRAEPAIDVDRAYLDFTITSFISPSATLDRLILDRPEIRIIEDANRRLNISNMFVRGRRERKGISLIDLAIAELTVRRGLVIFEDRPFYIDTSNGELNVEMKFIPEDEKYTGTARISRLDIRINGFGLRDVAGSMEFDYLEDQLRFPSFTLDSEELDVRAVGAITSLRAFIFKFETDISANLPKFARPKLSDYFQSGVVNLAGTFAGRKGDFAFDGRGSSAFVRFEGLAIRDIDTRLKFTPDYLFVPRIDATMYGGSVQAEGKLGMKAGLTSEFQVVSRGVSIDPLLTDLGQEEMEIRGRGDFSGSVTWPELKFAQLEGAGTVSYEGDFLAPSIRARPVPFQGTSEVAFQLESARLRDGVIRTAQSLINYQGRVTFKGAYDLAVRVESKQGQELVSLARSLGLVSDEILQKYQPDVRGPATVVGQIEGFKTRFVFEGQAQGETIYLQNELIGDFRAQVTLTPNRIELANARLTGPDFQIQTSLRFPVGQLPELRSFRAQFERVPIERFTALTGRKLPIQGRVTGRIDVEEVAPDVYRGEGALTVVQPRAYGEALNRLTARIQFEGSKMFVTDVRGTLDSGTVTGELAIDLKNKIYDVDLQGTQIPLPAVKVLQRRVPLRGRANFSIQGTGNLQNPDYRILATAQQVFIREHMLGDVRLEAVAQGQQAQFKLVNGFRGNVFSTAGRIGVREPYPVNATIDFQNTPIAPYVSLIPAENVPNVGGRLNGEVTVTGPLQYPARLQARGTFPQVLFSMAGYEVHNVKPLQLTYEAGTVNISPLTLVGAGTELDVSASLKVEEPRTINARIQGTANLLILNSFLRAGAAAGQLNLETTIFGPLARPRLVGAARLRNGFFSHPDVPATIADATGSFKFTANQVSIDDFTARTGQGRVNAEGGIFLEGFRPARWRINIFGSGLRLEYPANVASLVDVDLDWLKGERTQLISGAVYVRAAEYRRDITIPELIMQQITAQAAPPTALAPGQEIALNIDVEAHRSIAVRNNLATVVASGDFILRGTLDNPVILGRIIIDEGRLFLENNRYEIVRGAIAFNNPRRTTPILNFEAETEIRDFTVTILMRGPFDRLTTSFRSEPPMPTASIVSLLAVGQTQEEIFGGARGPQTEVGTLAFYGAGALLSKSIGEIVETRTSRLFGFDRFSIDPFLMGEERNPAARITLGKQLTENLTVTYSHELGSEVQAQVVIIEYALTPWLTAVGTRGATGDLAIDFKLKKRF